MRVVSDAWRSVLDIEGELTGQDFFELGGDSLTAVALVERIKTDLGIDIPLEVIFFDGRLSTVVKICVERLAARHVSVD